MDNPTFIETYISESYDKFSKIEHLNQIITLTATTNINLKQLF